jgi:exodeoxyribonuclease VII large subunit
MRSSREPQQGSQGEPSEAPLSVAELDRMLRRAVESVCPGVWVQGELGGLRVAASGHAYFTLKDEREEAVIEAVAYRETAARARALLADGARVLVRGKATVWAPRGRLQLVVDAVRPAGRGALLEALERLKQRLAEEGLFALERKRPVPADARVVGVVTSASGAVLHDIIRVAFRRGAARIVLSPTLVQGEGAPEGIVAALERIERLAGLDVVIVARGGGSAEDLMAFNDERVVRRVAACAVPTVSAVGHEVDVTLTDLVADARASTPSQAAEMVVADAQAQRAGLEHVRARLRRAARARLLEDRAALERLERRLGDPRVLIAERRQLVDEVASRLRACAASILGRRRTSLARLERRLVARHPRAVLAVVRGRLGGLRLRLGAAAHARCAVSRALLGDRAARLRALSPLAVLARGYAIATGPDGRALLESSAVRAGDPVGVRLRRGRLWTEVLRTEHEARASSAGSGHAGA